MAINKIIIPCVAVLIMVAGCGVKDDLVPSGKDKRPAVQLNVVGHAVGQQAPDFTVSNSLGTPVTLSQDIVGLRGVVLYFTMWCPICDTHMSRIRDVIMPANPDIRFYAVDYVGGSVSAARNSEVQNGYDGSGFVVLADTENTIENLYDGTMGTTVVIDKNGIVQMNEDFKDGVRLQSILEGLP